MDPLNPEDELILSVLREQDLLTKSQETRVRSAMKRGMSVGEAIQRTPLVDPVKFTMMMALASTMNAQPGLHVQEPSRGDDPAQKPPRDFTPIQAGDEDLIEIDEEIPDLMDLGGEKFEFRNLGPVSDQPENKPRVPEKVSTPASRAITPDPTPAPPSAPRTAMPADFDADLDLDIPEEPIPVAEPPRRAHLDTDFDFDDLEIDGHADVPESKNSTESYEVPRVLDANLELEEETVPPPPPAPARNKLRPAGKPAEYDPPGGRIQSYDLGNDEGIPLIGKVNAFLREAVEEECGGLEFDIEPGKSVVHYFDSKSEETQVKELDGDTAQKYVNRLKVMARLEPWRRQQAQKGKCLLTCSGRNLQMLVDQEPGPEGHELITLYLLKA
jgi:hypothetical protein